MQLGGAGNLCTVTLTAPARMAAPVHMFYELDNFYQNHRRCASAWAALEALKAVQAQQAEDPHQQQQLSQQWLRSDSGRMRQLPVCPGARFVTSRSDPQLRGLPQSMASLKRVCDPQLYMGGNTSDIIDPCGLVAWASFNDTFQVFCTGCIPSLPYEYSHKQEFSCVGDGERSTRHHGRHQHCLGDRCEQHVCKCVSQ